MKYAKREVKSAEKEIERRVGAEKSQRSLIEERLKREHEEALQECRVGHDAILKDATRKHVRKMAALVRKHGRLVKDITRRHQKAINGLTDQHEEDLRRTCSDSGAYVAKLQKQLTQQSTLIDRIQGELNKLKAEKAKLEIQIKSTKKEVTRKKSEEVLTVKQQAAKLKRTAVQLESEKKYLASNLRVLRRDAHKSDKLKQNARATAKKRKRLLNDLSCNVEELKEMLQASRREW